VLVEKIIAGLMVAVFVGGFAFAFIGGMLAELKVLAPEVKESNK